MRLICVFVLALTFVINVRSQNRTYINDDNNPIRYYDTSLGENNHTRVEYIVARILPRHIRRNERINFPRSGAVNRYFLEARGDQDERGHLVANQFSGPPAWYNLSPQNSQVNRNSGARALTTDWFNTECEVRSFLENQGDRSALWEVRMQYEGTSNRPDYYNLAVQFFENGNRATDRLPIQTSIHNPLRDQTSRWWQCNANCTRHNHWYDDVDEDDDPEYGELGRRRRSVSRRARGKLGLVRDRRAIDGMCQRQPRK